MLSDGRCVYFVPDARAKAERGLTNDEAWAEYAIHAVTSSGQKISGKSWNERLYNKTKAANIWRIENILKAERCEAKISDDPEKLGVVFFGRGVDGRTIQIITRFDDRGNILADLSELTVITGKKEKKLPPHKPLAEVVEAVAHKLRGGLLTVNEEILSQNCETAQGRFSIGWIFTGSAADYANRDTPRAVEMLFRRSDTTLSKATATALNEGR